VGRSPAGSAGKRLRRALRSEFPLQIVGVVNAYAAVLAENCGFKAIYLSGAGVANASYGVPDIGLTRLEDVLVDVRRISGITKLPLLVDADTGWGDPKHTAREMIKAGAAGMHIEDQEEAKKCGHLGGKRLVSAEEMVDRIDAANRGRRDEEFVIMARTDAVASEGLQAGIRRAQDYIEAGADMIFAEALTDLEEYRAFVDAVKVPVLANITEFGRTPLFTTAALKKAGVRIALYPLSAFRGMNAAALRILDTIRSNGTQKNVLGLMQTRAELYRFLGYEPGAKK